MARTLTSNNATEVVKTIVREHFLVKISFTTPKYFSSREQLSFDSQTWVGVNMELELTLDGSGGRLSFLDEDFDSVDEFIAQGSAGIVCEVWAMYGDPTFTTSDDDLLFSGELGAWAMNDDVLTVQLETPEAKWLPDIYINVENGFNHLPRPGTRISTPDGIIELGKST